jgi:hypothetical protein
MGGMTAPYEVRTEQAAPRVLAAVRTVTTPQQLGRAQAGVNWEVYGDWDDDPAKRRTDVHALLAPAT